MPTLKYHENGEWRLVGWQSAETDLVPDTGGSIVGPFPLVVDNTGYYNDLSVKGPVLPNGMTTTYWGALDMDIVLGPGRIVDLHEGAAYEVASSRRPDGAVTKEAVDDLVSRWDRVPIALVRDDWRPGGSLYPPLTAHRNREGVVLLQGHVVAVNPVEPSFANNIIGTLPAGWRPLYRCQFSAYSTVSGGGIYAQVDVRPDGTIQYAEGRIIPAGEALSLDGVSFNTT